MARAYDFPVNKTGDVTRKQMSMMNDAVTGEMLHDLNGLNFGAGWIETEFKAMFLHQSSTTTQIKCQFMGDAKPNTAEHEYVRLQALSETRDASGNLVGSPFASDDTYETVKVGNKWMIDKALGSEGD